MLDRRRGSSPATEPSQCCWSCMSGHPRRSGKLRQGHLRELRLRRLRGAAHGRELPGLPTIAALGKNTSWGTEIETRNVLFLPR